MNEKIDINSVKDIICRKLVADFSRNKVTRVYIGYLSNPRQRATIFVTVHDSCSRDYANYLEGRYIRQLSDCDELNVRVVLERNLIAVLPKEAQMIWEAAKFYV